MTSPWLIVIAAGLLGALLVMSVLDRPRPARPAAQVLTRAGRVLGVGGLSVLVSALVLNNQFLFYTSWVDLFGTFSPGTTHVVGSVKAARATKVHGPGFTDLQSPRVLPALVSPHRLHRTYLVNSPALGGSAKIVVELPQGYDQASPRTYPVVIGLHGFPGEPASYARAGLVAGQQQATSDGTLAASIIVMPQISIPEVLDTECVNGGPGQPQADTWLSRDLPKWIVDNFRVRTDRLSWAVAGYSYGGWCSASLAVRHPDVFGAALVFAGYFQPEFGADYVPKGVALGGYDLIAAERRSPVPVSIWVITSHEDSRSYQSTAKFLKYVKSPTNVSATVLAHGGHANSTWQPYIPNAMSWLGRTLPGFHA